MTNCVLGRGEFLKENKHVIYWVCYASILVIHASELPSLTDYGRPESKSPSLHGWKFNPNPKFLGTAEADFVCHIGPIFQIPLIYAFIGSLYYVPLLKVIM